MKKLKFITNTIYWICILVVILVALSSALVVFHNPIGLRMFVVSSGSMEPTIKVGSVALVQTKSEYQVQDIITFQNDPQVDFKKPGSTTTHRLVEIKKVGDKNMFVTKGDANNAPDSENRDPGLVLGKVIFSLPYLGYLIAFAQTQVGLIILIVIPATMIIYSELMSIKKEVIKIGKKIVKSKEKEEKQDEEI